jgi:hypothetical protein
MFRRRLVKCGRHADRGPNRAAHEPYAIHRFRALPGKGSPYGQRSCPAGCDVDEALDAAMLEFCLRAQASYQCSPNRSNASNSSEAARRTWAGSLGASSAAIRRMSPEEGICVACG